jgi:DNA-binding LacI/PurR family transcriptional regulator/ABC-type glycerol-3-phosphate transport system substrate-binding protein
MNKKITIKDIAKLANVSHGTVSNVLNNKGNVSAKKIDLVLKVAREVGYQLNVRASALRANEARSIAIILPEIHTEQCYLFFESFLSEIQALGGASNDVDLFLSSADDTIEKDIIFKISDKIYKKIIVFSALESADVWYEKTNIPKDDFIFIYNWPDGAVNKFGLNYKKAGMDIANKIITTGAICLFCENNYSYISDFVLGLQDNLKGELHIVPSCEKSEHNDAINLISKAQYTTFITTSQKKLNSLLTAFDLTGFNKGISIYVLSDADKTTMYEKIRCYRMEYSELGRQVANSIYKEVSTTEFLIDNSGFIEVPVFANGYEKPTLKVLMNNSPSSEAIKKISGNFMKRSGVDLQIETFSPGIVNEIISDENKIPQYDIVRLDIALLPAVAEKNLVPMDEVTSDLDKLLEGYDEGIINLTAKVKGRIYSIPFDIGPQMLFYRKDLFDDARVRRLFFEKNGKKLTLPNNFYEYDLLCEFFCELHHDTGRKYPSGATAFVKSPYLIASEFLLRYYSAGGFLINGKNAPSLDNKIGDEVLTNYINYLNMAVKSPEQWWDAAVDNFETGKTSLLITYANLLNDTAHGRLSGVLGCVPCPNDISQLGGGVLGITRASSMKRAAIDFMKWLDEHYIIERRVLLGGSCMSNKATKNHMLKNTYPWMPYLSEVKFKLLRETVDSDGQPYNVLEAEYIIGVHLIKALKTASAASSVIEQINKDLCVHFGKRL